MADVLAWVSDAVLRAEFDAETLRRARTYAAEERVGQLTVFEQGPLGARVLATVQGSAPTRYSVLLTVTATDPPGWSDDPFGAVEVWSRCSCPVGDRCKHGAAVALVAAAGARSRVETAWESQLSAVLGDLERPGPTTAPRRLAIRVDVRPPSTHRWGPATATLTLRLVNEGARGGWVKSGISWAGIPGALVRGTHDADQLAALRGLHAGLFASGGYHSAVEEPELTEFGSLLWRSLAEAVAAGVPLVAGDRVRVVRLSDAPLDPLADVVATADGARLVMGVERDGRLWRGHDLIVAGRPVHGVALIDRLDDELDGFEVLLAPLSRPVPASTGDLLTASDPVLLPDRARDRWEQVLLPRLARSLRLTSSDDSVPIRPLPRPRLRLRVDWDTVTAAVLAWEWVYATGDDDQSARTCAIDSRDSLDGLRDPAAEAALLERIVSTRAWPSRPVAQATLVDADALRLALDLLPALSASEVCGELVQVVEHGRPDFRATDGPIEISFDEVPPGAQSPSRSEDDGPVDWLDLWVTVRVDDQQVPLAQVLAALTRGDEQIVLPGGLYVATSRPELRALADLVLAAADLAEPDRREPGRTGRADVNQIRVARDDLGTWAQVGDTGAVDDSVSQWVQRAHALRDLVELPSPEPTGVVSTLRDYQRQGFHWLAFLWQTGLGGVLADDMGLGKTLQVLALISHVRGEGQTPPFLVVAPTSVVTAWQSEAARHTPDLHLQAITSAGGRRGGASVRELAEGADLVVTTYTLLRLEADQYAEVAWAGLVLDEAQQIKNHRSKTYAAVRRIQAPFRLAVTGTPFENRLLELWSLLSITNPGLYPTAQEFSRRVVRPVEKDRDPEALSRFRARIKPFMLRRTKELVAPDLPPKQEQVLQVTLPPRHRRVYDLHLQRERQKILGLMADFDQNRIAIFGALTRLRQLALDPALVDPGQHSIGSAKLEVLVEQLVSIVAEGHGALVFSQFTRYLALVRDRLAAEGIELCYLDGSTRDRAGEIARFRSGAAQVFLISLKAGGVGLTLTEADYVYVLDPWWNPAAEAQAVDRAHRIGQDRPVLVYRLVSTDTIEEKVMELKERKAELFAQVVDGDGLLGEAITADDVRALVE